MAFLNEQIRNDVRGMFAGLREPVALKVFTQAMECEYCQETRQLVEEVAALSDRLSVEVYDYQADSAVAQQYGIDKIPGLAIVGPKDFGLRMYGIPSGYEFGSLIDAIKLASSGEVSLSPDTRQILAQVVEPVHIQVFITPT
jgi:alkyl hydroperoxide reductase subunit AhpF